MAPEIYEQRPYNRQADIVSLGIILFKLLTGQYPYYSQFSGVKHAIHGKPIAFGKHANVSQEMQSIVLSMVEYSVEKRLTWE